MESKIIKHFGEDCYFLTSLGSIFNYDEYGFMEEVNGLVKSKEIEHIYIVNSTHCTFVRNTIHGVLNYPTDAEKELSELMLKYWDEIDSTASSDTKSILLINKSMASEETKISQSAFVGDKITNKHIGISGLIYHKNEDAFAEIIPEIDTHVNRKL